MGEPAVQDEGETPGTNAGIAVGIAWLECRRGKRNAWCRGEVRRYQEENQGRRRLTGGQLTLRLEGVGSKQD